MTTIHSPRTALLVGLSIVALGGVAVAVWRVSDDKHELPTTSSQPAAEAASRTVAVRVFEVKASNDTSIRQLTGSVRPRYQTDVAFRVSGKILRRHIEVGDQVQAGQLLFELDPQDYQLQLKKRRSQLAERESGRPTGDRRRKAA